MIDEIVEMILKEARKGSRWDNYTNLLTVWQKLGNRIFPILSDLQKEWEEVKKDENKG
uniref:Uncharacterized protein n=1 Tax=viral metagenome TaxID=1070528 RepID=A0A6M3M600_9ZZZZ